MKSALNVLFLSSEVYPFSKTGGLGDVAGFLPPCVKATGIDIIVTTPLYSSVNRDKYGLRKLDFRLTVAMFHWTEYAEVYLGFLPHHTPVFFIGHDGFFSRQGLYHDRNGDFGDNLKRFSFFSRASLELARHLGFRADVIHCNDWQTAITPVQLKLLYRNDPMLGSCGSLLSLHNLGYQGIFPKEKIFDTGFGWDIFKSSIIEYYDQINLLKGGIIFSDILNTVSRRYAYEIQTPEFGFSLDTLLKTRKRDLYGILNGADYTEWNPETDRFLPEKYNADSPDKKQICKRELQKHFYLNPEPNTPVIGVVSRLVDQKGFDLLAYIMHRFNEHNVQFAILGTGENWANSYFGSLPFIYPGKAGSKILYNEAYAHLVIAGSDFLLMPSRYEPCGLNQMYAMKYGTLPIVRAVGGLDDTVEDYNEHSGTGTGFKFRVFNGQELYDVIKKAIYTYLDRKEHYRRMQKKAMSRQFSWEDAASDYISLYGFAKEKSLKGWY